MTATASTHRISLVRAFVKAAAQYWLGIYPQICREAGHWHNRAQSIPSTTLRELALEAQRIKRGNIEGSAAFAILAPRDHRSTVVRAQVAFQSIYDYVDTLSEQPSPHPIANSRHLHQALLDALGQNTPRDNYYAHQPSHADAGYLNGIIETCRNALCALPSHATVASPARTATERIVTYQTLNLSDPNGGHQHLARWALKATPHGSGLRWWETAASAGSSLGLFALIAAAAQPELTQQEATAIAAAYWPWIGALHSLLDSLVDGPEDTAAGQRNLLDYYNSPEETATRLKTLALQTRRAVHSLPNPDKHTLILTGMTSCYLTHANTSPTAALAAPAINEAIGPLAKPTTFIFTTRHTTKRLKHTIRRHPKALARLLTRTAAP